MSRKAPRLILAAFAAAALLAAAALVRAKFLPDAEVPIILYERVEASPGAGNAAVGADLFYAQLRELAREGYDSVKPWRLRAYKTWGLPLPEKPVIITFDRACKDLATVAGPLLADQGFDAIVLVSTSHITDEAVKRRQTLDGVEMMTWQEVRKAASEGVFSFGGHTRSRADLTRSENPRGDIRASRSDIKKNLKIRTGVFSYPFGKTTPEIQKAAARAKINFAMSYGDKVAKIGPKTNMLDIPRIRAAGGQQTFTVTAHESRSAEAFGFIRVKHASGAPFPALIRASYEGLPRPVRELEIPDFGPGAVFELPLPYPPEKQRGAMFPITVEIRDSTGVLLYYRTDIAKSSVKREAGTAINLGGEIDLSEIGLD